MMQVKTHIGLIQGDTVGSIARFRGIPYAQSPLSTGRFNQCLPIDAYDTIIDATQFKHKAPQPRIGQVTPENDLKQSVDCLYLNIWAPKTFNQKKPVLVWIHGGAFVIGETAAKMYDGLSFANNGDLVFVSIQYRLGLFGFIDFSVLNDDKMSFDSNVGLYDQIAALRWIKQNIAAFGGDQNNITVMGESAGATSILALMTSNISESLFNKAIVQSAVIQSVLPKKHAHFWAMKTLEYLNISIDDKEKLLSITDEQAIETARKIMANYTDITPGYWAFGPVIDGKIITDSIIDAYKKGKTQEIPMLIGYNKDEAALLVKDNDSWLPSNENQMEKMFTLNETMNRELIVKAYTDYPSINAYKSINRDYFFTAGALFIADLHAQTNDTYVYRFDYETILAKKMGIGAFHGAEIMYAFNNLDCELTKLLAYETDGPKSIADFIHQRWIQFVHDANPNPKQDQSWEKYTQDTRKILLIDTHYAVQSDPDYQARIVWKL